MIQAAAALTDHTVQVALISTGGTFLTAITSIIVVVTSQNKRFDDVQKRFDDLNRRFNDIDRRFDDVGKRFDGTDKRIDRIEHAMDVITLDIKEFFKQLAQIRAKVGE